MSILATRFKLSDALKVERKEGREEGLEEGIEVGRVEGRVEGIVAGRTEERFEIARRLLAMNIAVQDVIKATGLSADQIIALGVQSRP